MAGLKLALLMLLSSLLSLAPQLVIAHEVQPTVGDLTVTEGQATLELRINIEAFLASIDLDAVADTDDAANAADYDALRALPAEEIAGRASELLSGWNALPLLEVDGVAITLTSRSVTVPDDVDAESPGCQTGPLRARCRLMART